MTLDDKIAQVHGIYQGEHYRYISGLPGLGIPPFQITNGPAGVGAGDRGTQHRATAFPVPIALAASRDPRLANEADVASVMCAYPRVNGLHDCANAPLLNGVLKQDWSFEGFVIFDFYATRSTIPSALAGLDVEHPKGQILFLRAEAGCRVKAGAYSALR